MSILKHTKKFILNPTEREKFLEEFAQKDRDVLQETISKINKASSTEKEEFLYFLGKFFHQIRLNKNISLRRFCLKYNLDPIEISELERGLRLPSISLMDIYLRDKQRDKE